MISPLRTVYLKIKTKTQNLLRQIMLVEKATDKDNYGDKENHKNKGNNYCEETYYQL